MAPRYDDRLLAAILALDGSCDSIAEICRRAGTVAASLGLPRPSYVHVRRIVHLNRALADAERARREALREIAADVTTDLVAGRRVDAYDVAGRVRDAGSPTGRHLEAGCEERRGAV